MHRGNMRKLFPDHVPEKSVAVKLLNEIHTEQKLKKEVLRNGK